MTPSERFGGENDHETNDINLAPHAERLAVGLIMALLVTLSALVFIGIPLEALASQGVGVPESLVIIIGSYGGLYCLGYALEVYSRAE